jgi:hypothetical protein
VIRHFVAAEELLESLRVNEEWRVLPNLAFDDIQNLERYVFGLCPVFFVPLLKDRYRAARYLHV